MPTTITGTDGVSQVQAGAVESGDLPAGSVIQVVQDTLSAQVDISDSFNYVNPGLTASITPASTSNKILVSINANAYISVGTTFDAARDQKRINRNGVEICSSGLQYHYAGLSPGSYFELQTPISFLFLDSPASTSSLTYGLEYRLSNANGRFARFNSNANGNTGTSTLTLMEIAG